MTFSIRSGAIVAAIVASCLSSLGALAAPYVIVDADSGKMLASEQPNAPWFPASVTKLMTTYVALKAVRNGRITLDTPLVVSPRAAAMAPSKMGFKAGTEVTLDNALKIIMVKSANDVSVTVAEGIAGSVEAFADMMNREAAAMGMRESYFVNPNGLPDDAQRTSARDMAVLARALLTEFGQYDEYWGIGAIKFGKRVMQNTNGLVGRYPGTTGMKTGFICASGFNVVATAERSGRRLIVVVLGSPSAAERTIKAAELFDYGFTVAGWGAQSIYDLPTGTGTPPNMRPQICEKRGVPGEDDGEAPTPVASSLTPSDNPLMDLFAKPAPAASTVRGDGPRKLGPRDKFEPIIVYTGRKPGSTALARVPDGMEIKPAVPSSAQAYGPAEAAAAPPRRPGTVTDKAKPLRETKAVPAIAVETDKPAPRPGSATTRPAARAENNTKPRPVPTAKPLPAARPVPAPRPTTSAPAPRRPEARGPLTITPPAQPAS